MDNVPDTRPTLSELNEFRNAVAAAHAAYHNDPVETQLLVNMIENPHDHVMALRALVALLLAELDGAKRGADEVLHFTMQQSAATDTQPVRR